MVSRDATESAKSKDKTHLHSLEVHNPGAGNPRVSEIQVLAKKMSYM